MRWRVRGPQRKEASLSHTHTEKAKTEMNSTQRDTT